MSNVEQTRNKIRAKLEAIKKINENPKSLVDNTFENYKDDFSSVNGMTKKTITSFASNLKSKTQNKKDIFGELIKTTEGFLGTSNTSPESSNKGPFVASKLKKYAKDSARITLQESKKIVINAAKNALFAGTGVCGGNKTLPSATVSLSPKEFDFLNMLKVNPTSGSGKIMYEGSTGGDGGVKFNTQLFNEFNSGSPYQFNMRNNQTLFNVNWNTTIQQYDISGLNTSLLGGDFLDNYYESIEYPDIASIMKSAMLMTINGDGTDPKSLNIGLNQLETLLQKLFAICGTPQNQTPLKNNPPEQFNEDEADTEFYFNFDDTEGIDLGDEDSIKRRVMLFADCNNFEIEPSTNHIEDFIYFLNKPSKTLENNIDNTLNKTATDAFEQSNGSIPLSNFQINMINLFILKVPKALISAILSPKMIFPIVLLYKEFMGGIHNILDLMKKLSKLFFKIITDTFWKFIKTFWGFIKKDILSFVKNIASTILSNMLKRFKTIILALISLLTKVLSINIGSCEEIFNLILTTINAALNMRVKIPIPGLLLSFSDLLPGFSSDRAYMNITERLEAVGVNMGPLYGSPNKLNSIIKGIVDGHTEEQDLNGFIKSTNKTIILPGGIIIPGGILTIVGKNG